MRLDTSQESQTSDGYRGSCKPQVQKLWSCPNSPLDLSRDSPGIFTPPLAPAQKLYGYSILSHSFGPRFTNESHYVATCQQLLNNVN